MVDSSKVDFDPKVASTAISACSTLIEHLLTVQSFLGSRNVESFAGPPEEFNSGESWAEGFRKLDTDLGGALNGHIAAVKDLSEKFKAAIKEFKNAEDESIAGFLNQKMPDKLTNPAGLGPDYSKVSSKVPTPKPVEKYTQNGRNRSRTHAYTYTDFDLKGDRVAWPENPYVKDWDPLRALGESIHGVPGRLAADWGWMKDELNKAVTNFKTDTNEGHFRNSWTSGSGPIALAAVETTRTAITDLTSKMGDVEDRLYKAEGWLKATADRMPKGPAPVVSAPTPSKNTNGGKSTTTRFTATDGNKTYAAATAKDCMEMVLSKYREDCEAYYVAGIMEYNTSLVAIPQPEVPKVDVPPVPQPEQPKKDQPADTPQISPSGNPTGGNPSTPTVPTDTPTTPTDTPQTPQTPTTQNPTNTNTDTTLSTITSALTTLAQDGAQMVESLASQGSSLIQSLMSAQTTQKATDTSAQQLEQQLASLLTPTTPADPSSPGGTPGGTPTGGSPTTTPKVDTPKNQLFPRAAVTTDEKTETVTASRAGLATGSTTSTGTSSGSGMAGSPMGAAGAAGQGGGKEHKRPDYLKSGENLEGVFEAVPEAVTPVAEK
ncbi:hypothetical protein ACFXG4_09000 [Nocardia sp. NPDC059246]|uniref:hypothetical protein n=1 Tax=unclassified Nocardia TaxID=2637762 RepID=UPI003687C1AF